MKIYLDGAKHLQGQLNRIGEGFIELGYELTDFIGDADLIYSNNPSPTRTEIVKCKNEGKLKQGAKIIMTVLDYPLHLEGFESFQKEIPQIKADLAAADAICSISEYTQRMVEKKYGFDSTIIYNPMKPVGVEYDVGEPLKRYEFLHVGRRHDFNKNFRLVAESLMMLGFGEKDLGLVGSEVSWGSYIGVLSDQELNNQYFAADYVFSCGTVEGLSLTIPESMAAGCIPIVHNELTTREELLPSRLFPEYDNVEGSFQSIANFIYQLESDLNKKDNLAFRLNYHYQNDLRHKFNKVNVAKRILEVYSSL